MDITLFSILWIAYLQVHQFEPTSLNAIDSIGVEWVCKFDSTKTLHLLGPVASFVTSDQLSEIRIRDEDIVLLSHYHTDPYEQFGRVVVLQEFGAEFEFWLANMFESIKCDPDSDVDFSRRINEEKTIITTMTRLSQLEMEGRYMPPLSSSGSVNTAEWEKIPIYE